MYVREDVRIQRWLNLEGKSLFTFIMNDVEYHNNTNEMALRRFAEFCKILYENRSDVSVRQIKILMSVYTMCEQYGVNFYQFVQNCLTDKTMIIPSGSMPDQTTVTT